MGSVEGHYKDLLARHYTWMRGDYASRVRENWDFFRDNGLVPGGGGMALDLGCGSGFQSVALAELGFEVLGVDSSEALLDELGDRTRETGLRVRRVPGDLRDSRTYASRGPFEVAVCMGDTLTHLRSVGEVSRVVRDVYGALEEGGRLVLQFRDMTEKEELRGAERAIPVRSEPDRIFLTFLEYEPDHVNVHDLLFVLEASGWVLHKGVYQKLRLGMDTVVRFLKAVGFEVLSVTESKGLQAIIARKPTQSEAFPTPPSTR